MTKPTILLTGATGYIASHTWLALQAAGFDVLGVDNFSNSSPEVLNRLERIGGKRPDFIQADVCNAAALEAVFAHRRIAAAVHFAAHKAVGESTSGELLLKLSTPSTSKPAACSASQVCEAM
jgi:UDP-glucose 4-epimerase